MTKKRHVYADITLYDDNLQTIFKKSYASAEIAIAQADKIIRKKIKGY